MTPRSPLFHPVCLLSLAAALGGCGSNGDSSDGNDDLALLWAALRDDAVLATEACACGDGSDCELPPSPDTPCALEALAASPESSSDVLECLLEASEQALDCVMAAPCATDLSTREACFVAHAEATDRCPSYDEVVEQMLAACVPQG